MEEDKKENNHEKLGIIFMIILILSISGCTAITHVSDNHTAVQIREIILENRKLDIETTK